MSSFLPGPPKQELLLKMMESCVNFHFLINLLFSLKLLINQVKLMLLSNKLMQFIEEMHA